VGIRGAAAIYCVLFLFLAAVPAGAQMADPAGTPLATSPSEKLAISTARLFIWRDGPIHIYQADQPITIDLDQSTLHADGAVIWLQPADKLAPGRWHVVIALLGHASLQESADKRSGDRLLVRAELLGRPDFHVGQMLTRTQATSAIYRQGEALLAEMQPNQNDPAGGDTGQAVLAAGKEPAQSPAQHHPTTHPTTAPIPAGPVSFSAGYYQTIDTPEGTVAVVCSNSVVLFQRRTGGDFVEMRADSAVIFTTLHSLHDLTESQRSKAIEDNVTGVYLEGDVRIVYTPIKPTIGEQRLEAKRVYYDLTTDQAILTDAVVHTIDVKRQVPMVMRARVLRQLAAGEYDAEHAQLTTSTFALPSYEMAAKQMYIRTETTGPDAGDIYWRAKPVVPDAFGVPFFYLPQASGTISPNGEGLIRGFSGGNETGFGVTGGVALGLFESLGVTRPADLDALYRIDYFSERGPGFGLTADYNGGTLTDTSKEPLDFAGDFNGYIVYDKGTDDLGRLPVKFSTGQVLRGHAEYEHTHIFPDGWEAQIRLGYISDPTFLEQYFRDDFTEGLPHDTSAYLKHQDQTEALTLLVDAQPNHFVTTSDAQANQFEVERLPEVAYHRIGDSIADNQLTVFSDNSVDGLHFQRSNATLREQGFGGPFEPGLPSLGQTGLTSALTFRGDFRQEVDYPITAGPIRVVPYVLGRYTQYSESPGDGAQGRVFGAVGVRMSTELWKVDPTVQSDLFDLHELRHVIEPTINLFTSGETVDRGHLYDYDTDVDAINDVTAAQIALYQRWETKRGGPGQWRSVDAFSFNVELNLFANQPSKAQLNPDGFRGTFFPSMPEASLARNSINSDASWRISDNTVVLADSSYNLDKYELATAAIGLLVRRDVQTDYYIENRYIAALNSNVTSIHVDYEISNKYTVALDQSFDFSANKEVYSGIGLARRFDTFTITMEYIHNETEKTNSFNFSVVPAGLTYGVGTNALANSFHQ
jgi:hypothetical protein